MSFQQFHEAWRAVRWSREEFSFSWPTDYDHLKPSSLPLPATLPVSWKETWVQVFVRRGKGGSAYRGTNKREGRRERGNRRWKTLQTQLSFFSRQKSAFQKPPSPDVDATDDHTALHRWGFSSDFCKLQPGAALWSEPAASAQTTQLLLRGGGGAVYTTTVWPERSTPLLHFGPLLTWQMHLGEPENTLFRKHQN